MKTELGVILMVIVFFILSIVFGVFSYLNYKEIDPGEGSKTLDAVLRDERKKSNELRDNINEYTENKQRITEEIAKDNQTADYYRQNRTDFIARHEDRLKLRQEGEDFEKQVRDVMAKVAEVKQKRLSQIETDITTARTEMEKKLADVATEKAKIQAEVLEKKNDFQAKSKLHVVEMNYVNSQVGDIKQTLRDLTTREVIHANILDKPDGKVVLSDFSTNFVSINLGAGAGVKTGFRFEVYAMLPGNKHVNRAYIEVTKVGATHSDCLVVQRPVVLPEDFGYVAKEPEEKYNPLSQSGKKGSSAEPMLGGRQVMTGQDIKNPIIEGDLIQNPFFEAGRHLTFYIAGSKEVVGERQKSAIRYRWTEIRDTAQRYGAKVVPAVDTTVDYVIAQKKPEEDPEFKKAVDLGIPVIYEWELFRFLSNE